MSSSEVAKLNDEIVKAISICEERIRISKANQEKYNKLKSQRDSASTLVSYYRETANHMNRMYKNIKSFLENKKTQSKDVLEAAIRSTSAIVKDAELQTCVIHHENGKTRILNDKGQDINAREGSAARATMGFILRYTCLKAKPNMIQIMFLDEALATLSSTTSVNLREMLEAFSKDIGIVGIEQKSVLYSGLSSKRYMAVKTGSTTTIKEEEPDIKGGVSK